MEHIIERLSSNPIFLVIAAVLAVMLIFSIIKRFIKLIICVAVALIVFIGYLHFSGQEVPSNPEELKDAIIEEVDKVKEELKE